MPLTADTVILHTRWATQGSPENNDNNHPIVTGGVVGVHNGHLNNDDELFKWIGGERIGQVDSEAAFALLDRGGMQPEDALDYLHGRAALAWLDKRSPRDLHLARVSGSPLAIGQTRHGSLVFASTMSLLAAACRQAEVRLTWTQYVEEYTYLKVRRGVIGESLLIGDTEFALT